MFQLHGRCRRQAAPPQVALRCNLFEAMHEPLIFFNLKDRPIPISLEEQIAAALAGSRECMIVANRSMLNRAPISCAGRDVPLLLTANPES